MSQWIILDKVLRFMRWSVVNAQIYKWNMYMINNLGKTISCIQTPIFKQILIAKLKFIMKTGGR
jgi:hypothetical protein